MASESRVGVKMPSAIKGRDGIPRQAGGITKDVIGKAKKNISATARVAPDLIRAARNVRFHAHRANAQSGVASTGAVGIGLARKKRPGATAKPRHRQVEIRMKVIQPNCRTQFAAEDIDFIVSVLGHKLGDAGCLVQLLADEESRDLILDDEALLRALLERHGCLRVSSHFYFYVLVRNVLRRSDIHDRAVADYVAEVLAEFARAEQMRCVVPGQANTLDYFFEMLAALQTADDRTSFQIRVHIGNHSLFLSGVFHERIRFRAEKRGFPGLKYYEALGRAHYRAASDHRLAQRYDLTHILGTLSERFDTARKALNEISDRLFSLSDYDRRAQHFLLGQTGNSK